MTKLPADFPLYDGTGRRVWWVFLQTRDDNKPVAGFIECQTYDNSLGRMGDLKPRPSFRDLGLNVFWLTDDIHSWFEEQNIPYVLEYRWHDDRLGWHIGLRNIDSAVLTKLTWGLL